MTLYDLYAIFMLTTSWVLGMIIFCGIMICTIRYSKRVRHWLVKASMEWATEITSSILENDNIEEKSES